MKKKFLLLNLLYKEDKLWDNCFKFDSVFYKNVYRTPCNKNVVLNFETEKVYKVNIYIYVLVGSSGKLLDDLIWCFCCKYTN